MHCPALLISLVLIGTAYPSGAPEFIPGFSVFVLLIFSFMCNALLIVVCPSVLFLLAIVLSVLLQFMDSDYPLWYLQTLLGPPVDAKTKKWVN